MPALQSGWMGARPRSQADRDSAPSPSAVGLRASALTPLSFPCLVCVRQMAESLLSPAAHGNRLVRI